MQSPLQHVLEECRSEHNPSARSGLWNSTNHRAFLHLESGTQRQANQDQCVLAGRLGQTDPEGRQSCKAIKSCVPTGIQLDRPYKLWARCLGEHGHGKRPRSACVLWVQAAGVEGLQPQPAPMGDCKSPADSGERGGWHGQDSLIWSARHGSTNSRCTQSTLRTETPSLSAIVFSPPFMSLRHMQLLISGIMAVMNLLPLFIPSTKKNSKHYGVISSLVSFKLDGIIDIFLRTSHQYLRAVQGLVGSKVQDMN